MTMKTIKTKYRLHLTDDRLTELLGTALTKHILQTSKNLKKKKLIRNKYVKKKLFKYYLFL